MAEEHTSIEVIEKRRFLRLDDYFKVTFQPASDFQETVAEGPNELGFSKNLSLGGVAFVTDAGVDSGDYIRAKIHIPEIGEPIEVVGQVIRAVPTGDGRHDAAIKFLPFGMDEDQRNKLELFIYEHFLSDPLS